MKDESQGTPNTKPPKKIEDTWTDCDFECCIGCTPKMRVPKSGEPLNSLLVQDIIPKSPGWNRI